MSNAAPLLLVVDDDELNRDLLRRRLERAGFRVAVAEDGRAALSALERLQPDLVLLDLMMPGMSGLEVLREIRAGHLAGVPVVLVSAWGHSEDIVAEGLASGADDFICKPLDLAAALGCIRAQLAGKGPGAAAATNGSRRTDQERGRP